MNAFAKLNTGKPERTRPYRFHPVNLSWCKINSEKFEQCGLRTGPSSCVFGTHI